MCGDYVIGLSLLLYKLLLQLYVIPWLFTSYINYLQGSYNCASIHKVQDNERIYDRTVINMFISSKSKFFKTAGYNIL